MASMDHLIGEATAFASTRGLVVGAAGQAPHLLTHVPFALAPSPVRRGRDRVSGACSRHPAADRARRTDATRSRRARASAGTPVWRPRGAHRSRPPVAPLHLGNVRCSGFLPFISGARPHDPIPRARSAASVDDFTGRLVEIYKRVIARGRPIQPTRLSITRSDYMQDSESGRLLQVELNMIASSFGALSAGVTELHRHMLHRFGEDLVQAGLASERPSAAELDERLPHNQAVHTVVGGLAAAHRHYGDPTFVARSRPPPRAAPAPALMPCCGARAQGQRGVCGAARGAQCGRPARAGVRPLGGPRH